MKKNPDKNYRFSTCKHHMQEMTGCKCRWYEFIIVI